MDRLKILVVDDESRMRKLVRDFLVKNNFDVIEAEKGFSCKKRISGSGGRGWQSSTGHLF